MDSELMKLVGGGGVFGSAVFFAVKYGIAALERLYNDMKIQNEKQLAESIAREAKYQEIIKENNRIIMCMAEKMELLNHIKEDVDTIKDCLKCNSVEGGVTHGN